MAEEIPTSKVNIHEDAKKVKSNKQILKIVPHWKRVLKTYSFWFYISAIILTFVEQVLPILGIIEPMMTGTTYAIMVFTLNLFGVIARFIQQKSLWQLPEDLKEPKDDQVPK